MPGITLIFSAFERNFVLSLGAEIQSDGSQHQAPGVTVVESRGSISQPVGFSPNQEEEEEEDDAGVKHHRFGSSLGGVSLARNP